MHLDCLCILKVMHACSCTALTSCNSSQAAMNAWAQPAATEPLPASQCCNAQRRAGTLAQERNVCPCHGGLSGP